MFICTMANCPLDGGVRYWESPLREVPLYYQGCQKIGKRVFTNKNSLIALSVSNLAVQS